MKKNLGIILVLFSLSGILLLFSASSVIRAEDNQSLIPIEELSRAYKEALISPLNKAATESNDSDLASFCNKLIHSYELDKTVDNSSNDEAGKLSNLLPDIKKINKAALDLTLKEAGKKIKDKEIAEFYDSFITRIGVDK